MDVIPIMRPWLGEEEAAITMHADQKAMAPDLNIFRGDWLWRGKDAEFDFQNAGFVKAYGIEAGIFEGGRTSGIGDGAVHRTDGQDISDAAAQAIVEVEGAEKGGEEEPGPGKESEVGEHGGDGRHEQASYNAPP